MSTQKPAGHYFRFPLGLLRFGESEFDALEAMASWGAVNAGVGQRRRITEVQFEQLWRIAIRDKEYSERMPAPSGRGIGRGGAKAGQSPGKVTSKRGH